MTQKILILSTVSSTLWVFYRGLIAALRAQGHDVTVAAANDYCLERFADEYGCRIVPLQLRRRIAPLHDLICLVQLIRLMRFRRYDLVHAHTPKAGLLGMTAAWLAGISNRIYTLHGLPLETAHGLKRILLRITEKVSLGLAASRLVVSESLANRCLELGLLKKDHFRILGDGSACGVDRSRFNSDKCRGEDAVAAKQKLNIPADALVIGFVGRVTPDKGIDVLLDVFEQLCCERQNVHLLIIGDYDGPRGERVAEYRRRIQENKRISHCTFTEDIVPLYGCMDMLVLPSKREGFNYALLEASACGLPVIAARVVGCVDAVIEGKTGLLVHVENRSQLNAAIDTLLSDSKLRAELGKNGEQRIAEHFDSRILINEHMRLYQQCLKQVKSNAEETHAR